MRQKLSKLVVVFAFFATVAIGNLSPLTASAAVDVCTWTGAVSANWNNAGNWTGCDNGNLPETGDALIFPASASNKTMNNDFVSLQASSLTFNGTGYTVNGAGFTVGNAITVNESATINANMTLGLGASHFTFYPLINKTLTLNGVSAFNVTGFYEVNVGSPTYKGTVDFTGNITGTATGQLIAVDEARAIVRGSSNTFTSAYVGAESDGVFECRSTTCFGNSANKIYMGGGGVQLYTSATYSNGFATSTATPYDSWMQAYESISITGDGTVTDPVSITQNGSGKSLQFTGAVTLDGNVSTFGNDSTSVVRFDGAVSGPGGFSIGNGTTRLGGSNSFQDTIFVNNNAILQAATTASLGSASGATVVLDGGSLVFDATSAFTTNEPITTTGDGNADSFGAIRNNGTDDVTLGGAITLSGDSTISNTAANTSFDINGVISGSHDLTYHAVDNADIGVGGGSANTYTGSTTVTGSVVYLEKTLAIPGNLIIDASDPVSNEATVYTYAPNAIADDGTVTLTNDSDQLRVGDSGTTEVIGGLIGATGIVSFQYGDSDLAIDQDFNSTFGGDFYADGDSPTITKRGTGNLLLTGGMQWDHDDNVKFVVEGGTLTVNGDLSTADGTHMEVKDTGKLKGNGKVGKVSTNGGTIAPGNSPGKLTVGSLTLDPTNTVEFELDGPIAGTSYDQIVSSGAVNLANATLSIKPSYTPSAGQVFTIITGSSITGTFKNMPNNSTVIVDGITFKINYTATSVTLTYVSGTYDPNASDSLVNTGTGMLLAALASVMLIAAATVLTTRRQRQPIA